MRGHNLGPLPTLESSKQNYRTWATQLNVKLNIINYAWVISMQKQYKLVRVRPMLIIKKTYLKKLKKSQYYYQHLYYFYYPRILNNQTGKVFFVMLQLLLYLLIKYTWCVGLAHAWFYFYFLDFLLRFVWVQPMLLVIN